MEKKRMPAIDFVRRHEVEPLEWATPGRLPDSIKAVGESTDEAMDRLKKLLEDGYGITTIPEDREVIFDTVMDIPSKKTMVTARLVKK